MKSAKGAVFLVSVEAMSCLSTYAVVQATRQSCEESNQAFANRRQNY